MITELVKIGTISKTHGHKGDIVLHCGLFEAESLKNTDWIFVDLDPEKVPFRVLDLKVLDDKKLLIKLKFVESIDDANKIVKRDFYILEELIKDSAVDSQALLVGFKVLNVDGDFCGVISSLIENKFQTLLEVENESNTYLIPFDSSFLMKLDRKKKTIKLDFPEELMDL